MILGNNIDAKTYSRVAEWSAQPNREAEALNYPEFCVGPQAYPAEDNLG